MMVGCCACGLRAPPPQHRARCAEKRRTDPAGWERSRQAIARQLAKDDA
eukprot:gene52618-39912_t